MKLLVKADDFGFTEAISHGIIKAYRDGIVRSTGIMINMPHAAHAIQLWQKEKGLCLGLHVNLVVGKPVSHPSDVSSLIGKDGNFHSSSTCREHIALGIDPISNYDEGYREVEAQLLKFYAMMKQMPAYLEGHAIRSHNLNRIYADIAKKYNILHISFEDGLSHMVKHMPIRANSIYDWYDTKQSPELYFTQDCGDILSKDYCLVVMHPGYMDYEITQMSSFQQVRIQDLYALTHPDTLAWVRRNNVELISHRDIEEQVK